MKTLTSRLLLAVLMLLVLSIGVVRVLFAVQQPLQRDLVKTPLADDAPKNSVPRGYALIIGIAKYKNLDPSMQLQFPESDAEAMYRVLISKEGGAFPAENVHLLKGQQATLSNIRHELEDWLPAVAQPADRVVVYFAGHGFVKDAKGYLAAWDLDPESPDTTGYPMAALGDVLAHKVQAKWKVLLTDACHSGKINEETTNESVSAELKNLPGDFLTFTATTARERSYEDPNLSTGFGLFSYYLIQAWKGYADNDPCDGRITADELVDYVKTNVKRYAREHGITQSPTPRGDYEPEMLLGVGRECLNSNSESPSMFGTAVVETNMDEVDMYLDGAIVGTLLKSRPLVLPGLSSGLHKFEGRRQGYEPDKKEIMIPPGQETTVSIRIRYVKPQIKKSALDLGAEGEKLLTAQRSTINPLNIVPVQRTQGQSDLLKARDLFTRALNEDPSYREAAFHLGQVNQLLSNTDASVAAYRRAIQIDPGYVDARLQYAAVLIENGDPDEAIRQLNEATRLDASNDEGYSLLARAFWDKQAWGRAVEMADQAIKLKASNDQAHLWKADSLRQLAASEKQKDRQRQLYEDAREDYKTFLNLTNFETPALDWVAFHFVGFHVGSRTHADRQSSYISLRSSGYLGMCLSEQKLGNPLRATEYCNRAIKYDAKDPIATFILGNVYRDLYNSTRRCDYLVTARQNYVKTDALNSDIAEARNARAYIEQIDSVMPELRRNGCH